MTANVYGAIDKVSKAGDVMFGPLEVESTIASTEAVTAGVVTLGYAAQVQPDASTGGHFRLVLQGNVEILTPVTPTDGQKLTFELVQTSGGAAVTWDTGYRFGDAGAPVVSIAAGVRDLVGFVYSADIQAWLFAGIMPGF